MEELTYNLDPRDAWERLREYKDARGDLENTERMWLFDSPIDFMEESLGDHFLRNEYHIYRHFLAQLKKESHAQQAQ